MKKTLVLAAVAALALASCDAPFKLGAPADQSGAVASVKSDAQRAAKAGDQVAVEYTGSKSDGSVFDATSLHDTGPLRFTVGAGQMIKGFDDGVVGMKVGETKTIVIPPEQAYGPKTQLAPVPMAFFTEKPTEQTVPAKAFAETVTQDVAADQLPAGKAAVGATIDLRRGGAVATVTSLSGGVATLTLPNLSSPFLGKKIAKGTKGAAAATVQAEIVAVKGDQVTVRVYNPFYGKKIKAGLSADMGRYGVVKVVSVDGSGATLELPNDHELAGETLTFQVKMVEIK